MQSILPSLMLSSAIALGSCGPSSGPADPSSAGASLYRVHCAACHGGGGSGSPMGLGPTLRDLLQHWEAGSLTTYLSDPAGYSRSDPRLGSRPMPAWPDSLTADERASLVDHALGLMR